MAAKVRHIGAERWRAARRRLRRACLFYQSDAADRAALVAAAEAKRQFLARYPRFERNAEVRLYLAVDYQDLFRRSREAHDAAGAAKYRRLARAECLRITRLFPGSDQSDAARQILRGLKN